MGIVAVAVRSDITQTQLLDGNAIVCRLLLFVLAFSDSYSSWECSPSPHLSSIDSYVAC